MTLIELPPTNEARIERIAERLPDTREALLAHAKASMEAFDTAIMAGNSEAAQEASHQYQASIWSLNNRTFFGCRGGPDAPGYQVARYCAAEPGELPRWGQQGEFLVSVEGIGALVKAYDDTAAGAVRFDFHALDPHRAFISPTGYRSGLARIVAGTTPEQTAVAYLVGELTEEGWTMIEVDYRECMQRRACAPWIRQRLAELVHAAAAGEAAGGQTTWLF